MEVYHPAIWMIAGVLLLIVSFYFWARMFQDYLNNLESGSGLFSAIAGALGVGCCLTGVLIL